MKLDPFEREVFAEEVSKKIVKEHNSSVESFIFGISGHWGEGKTYLLKLVEGKLLTNGFEVVWFSPWKYSGEKQSLMRRFITLINEEVLGDQKISLEDFEKDKTSLTVNWSGLFWPAVYWLGAIIFVYWIWGGSTLKILLPLIGVPGIIAAIVSKFFIQNSERAVTSVDQFDRRLELILKKATESNKKIVVFVDDLDRVTGDDAKVVLDALRTFFDKRELSYIVTGDHRVLENFIGKKLEESGDPEDEGRRFLKKIFNVYWRLPIPTESQLREFIKEKTINITLSRDDLPQFQSWLLMYFDNNPRQIERFIEKVRFNLVTFKIKGDQLKKDKDVKAYKQIKMVLDNKMLLIRALMFEENCYPFFESIVRRPSLIREVEEQTFRNTDPMDLITKQYLPKSLPPSHRDFLATFLAEKPRFFDDGELKVQLIPFFRFAADAGLVDDTGPVIDLFDSALRAGEIDKLGSWFSSNTEDTLEKLAARAQELITGEGDLQAKRTLINTLLHSISKVSKAERVKLFIKTVSPSIRELAPSISTDERMEIYNNIFVSLDRLTKQEANGVLEGLAYTSPEDFDRLPPSLGTNSSLIIAKWIVQLISQDATQGVQKFSQIANLFNSKPLVATILDEQVPNALNVFVAGGQTEKDAVAKFMSYSRTGESALKSRLKSEYYTWSDEQKTHTIQAIVNNFGKKNWGRTAVEKWIKKKNGNNTKI